MEKYEAAELLPRVGDIRLEVPTITDEGRAQLKKPQRCVVVEVNSAHLWYRVEFDNGFRESYKVPKVRGESQ